MPSATVYDFRDLDLMVRFRESLDGMTSGELSDELGLGEEGIRHVAIRLAWMKRYGMLEHDEDSKLWRLSAGGERVTSARLKAAQAKTIEAIPDESLVDVMAHVCSRFRLGDRVTSTMLRREFQYGTKPR
jgi:hypothetical protein